MQSNSFSQLDIARYCGQAPRLSKEHGAGISALQSQAYHALLANEPEARDLLARLPDKERAEVESWGAPEDCEFADHALRMADAQSEVPLALDEHMSPTSIEHPQRLTRGRADVCWPAFELDGRTYVAVADHKRSRFTSSLDTLQLDAAGIAWAQLQCADGYFAGLWILEDRRWLWRRRPVLLDPFDPEYVALCDRIRAAARNSETVTGPHCQDCWSRQHCPEYLLPAASLVRGGGDPLEAFGGPLTPETAPKALATYEAAKTLVELLEGHVKDYARKAGGIRQDGKVWRETFAKSSKVELDRKALAEKHPELIERFTDERTVREFNEARFCSEMAELAQDYMVTLAPKKMGFRWANDKEKGK